MTVPQLLGRGEEGIEEAENRETKAAHIYSVYFLLEGKKLK